MSAAHYWFRHNPEFCRTGDTFTQPVREGLLRPEFRHGECGFLDAPQYICTGGIRVDRCYSPAGDMTYLTERADDDRELMSERADPRDPYEGAYWGDEHGDMGLVS